MYVKHQLPIWRSAPVGRKVSLRKVSARTFPNVRIIIDDVSSAIHHSHPRVSAPWLTNAASTKEPSDLFRRHYLRRMTASSNLHQRGQSSLFYCLISCTHNNLSDTSFVPKLWIRWLRVYGMNGRYCATVWNVARRHSQGKQEHQRPDYVNTESTGE